MTDLRDQIERMKDASGTKQQRRAVADKIQQLEEALRRMEDEAVSSSSPAPIADWLVRGIGLFVDTFFKDHVHIRVYPFESNQDFHFLSNLKRGSFIDENVDHLIFTYGSRPNLKLTLFGLISSVPPREPSEADLPEVRTETSGDDAAFEAGMRSAFRGLEGMERMFRFSRYPNVTLYPLAVYRTIRDTRPRGSLGVANQ